MSTVSAPVREITVAHSPDSDDAFMFYGLATNKVRVPGFKFSHTLCDIETLNRQAQQGVYDVTAISFHAYPYIQDDYALMSCGGSVGDGYGPMLVSTRSFTLDEIKLKKSPFPANSPPRTSRSNCLRRALKSKSYLSIKSSRRFSKANTKPDSSSTKVSLPTTNQDCIASSIWAGGGRKSPDCRCRSAETPFAARSARKPWRASPRRCARASSTPSIIEKRP